MAVEINAGEVLLEALADDNLDVKEFVGAVAVAVSHYNRFTKLGVKKYCTVSRKDLQSVKKLADGLRKKALEIKNGEKQ